MCLSLSGPTPQHTDSDLCTSPPLGGHEGAPTCPRRVFKDPSDLLLGLRRVSVELGGITVTVYNTVLGELDLPNNS